MADYSDKFNQFSYEFNKAYKYFLKKQSDALDEYFRHMYEASPVYWEEYMRELERHQHEFRRRVEELRREYKEILTG